MKSIVSVIKSYGIQLKKIGSYYKCVCPFHDDLDPSLVVYPKTNSWYCFGCQQGGSVLDFISLYEGIPKQELKKKFIFNNKKIEKIYNKELLYTISKLVYKYLKEDFILWSKLRFFLKKLDTVIVKEKFYEEDVPKVINAFYKIVKGS